MLHAVLCHKKAHYGRLPPKMRRLFYKATMKGCSFITRSSTVQADYEHMVVGMVRHDFDLNPHLGPDVTGMDDQRNAILWQQQTSTHESEHYCPCM